MGRKSKLDILENRMIAELESRAFNPELPTYITAKAMGTLAALMRRIDKRRADKAKAAAQRRAERDQARMPTRSSWQGDNGRLMWD
jgi:hypothetical protein